MRHPSLIASNSPATLHRGGIHLLAPDVYQPQSMRGLHDCFRLLAQSNTLLVPNSIIICQVIGLVTAYPVFWRSTCRNLEVATDPG
jgi:hypothetical protein